MKLTNVFINFLICQVVLRAHKMQFWKPCLKFFPEVRKVFAANRKKTEKSVFRKTSSKTYLRKVEYSFDNPAETLWPKVREIFG